LLSNTSVKPMLQALYQLGLNRKKRIAGPLDELRSRITVGALIALVECVQGLLQSDPASASACLSLL
jgi:hypothetical protein